MRQMHLETCAPAKINLTLSICGKRSDGYHELSTIMHSVPLFDSIRMDFRGDKIVCETNFRYIRSEKNTAVKAARLFYERSGIEAEGIRIKIFKGIPVGAGMGGGSSDAAAVLKLMNKRYEYPFSPEELNSLAASVGADVPFCLNGGSALCRGIGEIITPVAKLPKCNIVIAKPEVSLSTAEMFAFIDSKSEPGISDSEKMIAALESGELDSIAAALSNDMQSAAIAKCPVIGKITSELVRMGALGANMSGSGSAVFGIFSRKSKAEKAAAELRKLQDKMFVRCVCIE